METVAPGWVSVVPHNGDPDDDEPCHAEGPARVEVLIHRVSCGRFACHRWGMVHPIARRGRTSRC